MVEDILSRVRAADGLKNAIFGGVMLEQASGEVTVNIVTDRAYTQTDYDAAVAAVRPFVPDCFSLSVHISKLSPDCSMVKRKIISLISENFPALSSVIGEGDVSVARTEEGFSFEIRALPGARSEEMVREVCAMLKKCYCGNFFGCVAEEKIDTSGIVVEREAEEAEYETPVRSFEIQNFEPVEGGEKLTRAIYIGDFNFVSERAVVCGTVLDVSERAYTRSNGEEKPYFNFTITDGTGNLRLTWFSRKRSLDKVRAIKAGESIACVCRSEVRGGMLRYTATEIGYGSRPENFVPEKRPSRPVPNGYHTIKPQPFTDYTQTDLFTDSSLPECFRGTSFVVFDLETTGLCTVPVPGEMDGIIELGAFKVIDGEIREKFSTFVNPERPGKLDPRIVELTGITDADVKSAPSYKDVLPDFVKFCDGSVLVGHNAIGFDFKFIDFYCRELGYAVEGRVIDTLFLSQQLLRLSNNKLNTVAEHFGVTFNHHRAEDDALATAKIFIELIKIKKSFPDY